jgi:hypothetical protein
MASIEGLLQRGEIVHLKLRPHGVVFLRPAAWLTLAGLLFIVAPLSGQVALWTTAGLLFAAGGAAAGVEAALRRSSTELVVTDRRVLLRAGTLRQTVSQAFGPAIAGLEVTRDLLGRRLGYGWVRIAGLGRMAQRLPFGEPDILRTRIEALALARKETVAAATAEEAKPAEPQPAEPARRTPPVRLAVLNDGVDWMKRRQGDGDARPRSNGDGRPKANGDGRDGLRLRPELDRF